jgi:alpha-ribazole phosphatase/probable phosphoglycerate mutase
MNGMARSRVELERAHRFDVPYPGGQSYRQVMAQVGEFLEELSRGFGGARVLVIGHSATRWALDCLLNGEALDQLVRRPFQWQEGWRYTLPPGWTAPIRAEESGTPDGAPAGGAR